MGTSSILAWGKRRVGLPPPFIAINTGLIPKGVIPVGDQSAADLFVLVFGASRSGEVMIVSVPFAFQVRSLQGLVKLETELARRTARAQVKQLKSEKLSPCSRWNLERIQILALVQRCLGHCQPARSYILKRKDRHRINSLTGDQQNRQLGSLGSRSILLCFETEQNTAHFPLIFPGVTHARNWLTDNDLAGWQMIGRLITRGRNSRLKCLSTGSLSPPFPFPFLAIFSPNREPVHRLMFVHLQSLLTLK